MTPPGAQDILRVLPELAWCGAGVLLMLLQPFVKNRQALTFISMLGAAAGTLVTFKAAFGEGFGGLVAVRHFSLFFHWLIGLVAFLVILASDSYLERENLDAAEFYALILLPPPEWVCSPPRRTPDRLYRLEMSSISTTSSPGTAAIRLNPANPPEVFPSGSFATAFFLYGIALVYGATGSTNLRVLATADPSSNLVRWACR